MNINVDKNVKKAIQITFQNDAAAQLFFKWAADRKNDAAETNIDRVIQVTGISRHQAIELFKSLSDAGCGEYIIGRKGGKTRMRWAFSLRSLGRAAQGEDIELENVDPELAEEALDQASSPGTIVNLEKEQKLTISDAKRLLAESLGVSPNAIEIVIRG